ncbi:hypothetical protein, partial [Vibrio harveyi]|uniref:hypothetical protein n=1 Tax=Vibrio harveyi TaxID=669 RepID=UPI001E55C73A
SQHPLVITIVTNALIHGTYVDVLFVVQVRDNSSIGIEHQSIYRMYRIIKIFTIHPGFLKAMSDITVIFVDLVCQELIIRIVTREVVLQNA